MNQGKLNMVKQEMARINNILGMNHIYYCGQESHRTSGVAHIINKIVWNAVLGCSLKSDRMISVHLPRQAIQHHSNPIYATTTNAKEAKVGQFYEDLEDFPELAHTHTHTHTHKDVLFFIRYWNSKKLGSQEIPRVIGKFGFGEQNEEGQRLTEFCQENALIIINTLFQQCFFKRSVYTWTSPNGQYQNKLTAFFVAEDREAVYSQQKQD